MTTRAPSLSIRVLGRVEAIRDGVALDLGSPKQRRVLAVLALRAGEVVPVDTCLQAVWGPDAPPGTRRSLYTYVSNLRRVLDPGRHGVIERDGGGYRLIHGDAVAVDCVEFDRLVQSGRAQDLQAALVLWRGEPGRDLHAPVETVGTHRWLRTWARAAEQLSALHVSQGRPAEAVDVLEELLPTFPLDESLWLRYVVALSAAGRRADALDACARVRRHLADELGIDPSSALQELEAQLVRDDTPMVGGAVPPDPSPDRPSLAVLPFATLGDPSRAFFADGLVEDITTDLARFRDLFVVARHSTLAHHHDHADVRDVADRLGVRFLVEGSVQWVGDQARITAHLLDGRRGMHLWGRRYDRRVVEVLAVRDAVVADLLAHLSGYHGHVMLAEKRRSSAPAPGSLDTYERYLRAVELKHRFQPATNRQARSLLLDVLARQPWFARAQVALAWTWLFEVLWGWTDAPGDALAQAWHHARQAEGLDTFDAEVHWLLGELHMAGGDHDLTIEEYARAKELNPNLADVHANWCATANRLGMAADGVCSMELALRLNPNAPAWYPQFHGAALFGAGRYEEAVATLSTAPAHTVVSRLYLAASLEHTGARDAAREQVTEASALLPGVTIGLVEQIEAYRDPADQARLSEALRGAGLAD